MKKITYRNYHITHNPKPIPIRDHDWDFEHDEYDGPGDDRCGTAPSEAACRLAIDDIEGCDHAWAYVKDWGGDPSIPNGTFDCSFYKCKTCGEEVDQLPRGEYLDDEPDEDAYRDKRRGDPDYD